MNADVRDVYISPFSQCQCWLFSLAECLCVLSILCRTASTQDFPVIYLLLLRLEAAKI